MPTAITTWRCDICGDQYEDEGEANTCEARGTVRTPERGEHFTTGARLYSFVALEDFETDGHDAAIGLCLSAGFAGFASRVVKLRDSAEVAYPPLESAPQALRDEAARLLEDERL